ncbi:hypothetical protein [Aurantiacibacter sp. MUD61]|uniref:hypothetical protein n=1 Tax=Aurantiacibacter sp. MUD61 TaxID=3009083 RepID=UPI0022EFDBDD|nr:hypothetical protein [Aurantiacibacter sp. MUD61]
MTQVDAPSGANALIALVLIGSLAVMFFTRNSDEYTAELWRSGANAAFIVIAAWTLLGPFALGVIEGYNAAHEGREPGEPAFDWLYAASSTLALYAFYLTFHFKRLTGAL